MIPFHTAAHLLSSLVFVFPVSIPPAICEPQKDIDQNYIIPVPNWPPSKNIVTRITWKVHSKAVFVLFGRFTSFTPKLIQLFSLWGGAGGVDGREKRRVEWADR